MQSLLELHTKGLSRVDKCWAVVIMILNCLAPGSGTFWLGVCGSPSCCNNFLLALLMSITATIVVGWVWSIYFGYQIIQLAWLDASDLIEGFQRVANDEE